VFHMYRQPLVLRVQARPLGHRPAHQRAIELKTEIIMQSAGSMLLDDEAQGARRCPLTSRRLPWWLTGFLEIPFAVVFGQGSGHRQCSVGSEDVHPDFFRRDVPAPESLTLRVPPLPPLLSLL